MKKTVYKKRIFGKTYQFTCIDRNSALLLGSVGLYPDASDSPVDISINIVDKIEEGGCVSQNPAIFFKCQDGIITKFPPCTIKWKRKVVSKPIEIDLHIPTARRGIRAEISKFRSREFSTDIEVFEQILHELVLVPSTYFFEDLSLVHAAVLAVNNEAILLAGTGGTGKTSALLALRNDDRVSFVSDDIAVISKDGRVFPNLAWPKVYGYNLSSYITKHELLKGRGRLDRFQFNYKLRKNPKAVRRKVRPDRLYREFKNDGIPISKIIYLFRDHSSEIRTTPLKRGLAIRMGIDIMKTEYTIFHNHLLWDVYNSLPLNESPVLDLNLVFERWATNLEQAFEDKTIQLLHIPREIAHEAYLDFMNKFITTNG